MAGPENAERRLELPYSKVFCGGLDRVGSASTSATALNARASEVKHQSPDRPMARSALPLRVRDRMTRSARAAHGVTVIHVHRCSRGTRYDEDDGPLL